MSDGWCPFASRVESPNFGYPRGTHDQLVNPLAVVDHIMCGTMSGCRSWFRDPNSWASATFGVGKNGDIDQYISLNDCAWANGAVNKPYAIAAPVYTGQNPNMVTWSIEHEGWPQDIWTEAMYQADLKLKRWLWQRKSGLLLLGHCHIDSVTRSGCPGPNWPRDRLLRDLKEGDMDEQQIREIVRDETNWIRGFILTMRDLVGPLAEWPLSDEEKEDRARQQRETAKWDDIDNAQMKWRGY